MDQIEDETYEMSFGEFTDHMDAAGAELSGVEGTVETWVCTYAGRENILAGTYDHSTSIATLDLI